MRILCGLCFVVIGCLGIDPLDEKDPRKSFPARRAIDGTRGRKYYEPEEEDTFEIYRSDESYDSYEQDEYSDIRKNVPGEPGIDYPTYRTIPQTSFICDRQFRGYYADQEAGCQLFHVCDGNFLVSSFLCPVGSTFSQKLLTCDWWNKVDCSSTRSYYVVNSQSSVSQADDDEILRKAYEMTSLQPTPNKIFVETKNRNALSNSNAHVNELQTGSNRFSDYTSVQKNSNFPEQSKFSSKYSALEFHDRDIDYYPKLAVENQQNPSIKVHSNGQDRKNDVVNQANNVRPSYMPTVPTVTTTARTYYSPTVPSITARSFQRQKYDLEFESSDHLYSARGKTQSSLGTATVSPVTQATIEKTTLVFPDVFPTLSDASQTKINQISSPVFLLKSLNKPRNENNVDKSEVSTEFNIDEFATLDLGINSPEEVIKNNSKILLDNTNVRNGDVITPATEILPPFFYYSNIEQHNSVNSHKPAEITESNSTVSWFDDLNINVPATDIVPPLLNYKYGEKKSNITEESLLNYEASEKDLTIFHNLPISQEINSLSSNNKTENLFDSNNLPGNLLPPSKLFLPPLFDLIIQNSSDKLQNYKTFNDAEQNYGSNERNLDDSIDSESSPYRVTLIINGVDETNPKNLIAKQESLNPAELTNIETVKSDESTLCNHDDTESSQVTSDGNDQRREPVNSRIINSNIRNSLRSRSSLRPVDSRSPDSVPRPFSLFSPRGFKVSTFYERGKIKQSPEKNRNFDSLKTIETTSIKTNFVDKDEQKTSTQKSDRAINFELPNVSRNLNFYSGQELTKNTEKTEIKKNNDNDSTLMQKSIEMPSNLFRVETEFIPSLGFSLNTDDEREKFMEAVIKGLFTDVFLPSTNKTEAINGNKEF